MRRLFGFRGISPQQRAVKEAIVAFVRWHGCKRGFALAAAAIGMGERAARHAYEGDEFAADRERAIKATEAQLRLIDHQMAQLEAERVEVERRRDDVVLAEQALDCGGGFLCLDGPHMSASRRKVTR